MTTSNSITRSFAAPFIAELTSSDFEMNIDAVREASQSHPEDAIEVTAPEIVFFDTEATGLGNSRFEQLISAALCDKNGKPIYNQRIRPTIDIDAGATEAHGITNEMLTDAPLFAEVAPALFGLLSGAKQIIGWNPQFDADKLLSSCHHARILMPTGLEFIDAMRRYGEMFGVKSNKGEFKFWKLTAAYEQQFGSRAALLSGAHDALVDCQMTADLWRLMERNDFIAANSANFAVDFVSLKQRVSVKGEYYAEFKTAGGAQINVFRNRIGQIGGLSKCLDLLAGYYKPGHELVLDAPIPVYVDFGREWPDFVGIDRVQAETDGWKELTYPALPDGF